MHATHATHARIARAPPAVNRDPTRVPDQAFAECLSHNTTLTSVALSNEGIGEAGGHALAAALRSNSSVTDLRLHKHPLGAACGKALAKALRSNLTLTRLDVSNTKIGREAVAALRAHAAARAEQRAAFASSFSCAETFHSARLTLAFGTHPLTATAGSRITRISDPGGGGPGALLLAVLSYLPTLAQANPERLDIHARCEEVLPVPDPWAMHWG